MTYGAGGSTGNSWLFVVNGHDGFQFDQYLLFFFRLKIISLRNIFTLFEAFNIKTNRLAAFGTQLFDTELGFAGNQRITPLLHYDLLKVYGLRKKTIKY